MDANQKARMIIISIPFIICLIFVASTGISCYRYCSYKRCGETGVARVIDMNTKYRQSHVGKYKSDRHHLRKLEYPVCEFEAGGQTYQFASPVAAANLKAGNDISICYEAGNPDNAWISGAGDGYLPSAIVTGIISIALLIGAIRFAKS